MTGRPADPLAVLREALAIAWPEGDHAEPNVYTEALAALDRVEAEPGRLTARRSRYAEGRYTACMEALSDAEARCARLQQALRPFVEDYDFHAADYLANDEDARVFSARTVDLLIEHRRAAREALAGPDTPDDSQEDKT